MVASKIESSFYTVKVWKKFTLVAFYLQAAACTAPTDEIKSAVIRSVKQTSHAYCQVLSQVNVVIKTPAHHEKQKFAALSKNVAASVGKVVEISVNLKGLLKYVSYMAVVMLTFS